MLPEARLWYGVALRYSKCSINYFAASDKFTETEQKRAPHRATRHVASAPPGGPRQNCRSGTGPPCTPADPKRLPAQRAPRYPGAKRKQPKESVQWSQANAGSGRYLCHSRCGWSSPRTPLGKQPPQARQLPDGWGPLWPPSFLLPDNTRDTKWRQQIRQHPDGQAPRSSTWPGPSWPRQASPAPCADWLQKDEVGDADSYATE